MYVVYVGGVGAVVPVVRCRCCGAVTFRSGLGAVV